MYELDEILANIRANEEIARKLFEIELKILSIDNFRGFFEELLLLIEEKFHIPLVWISVLENTWVAAVLEGLDVSTFLKKRVSIVPKSYLLDLFDDDMKPVLANADLRPFYRLLPQERKFLIKSIAIAPVTLAGNLIGSLNMGDFSESRFQPEMDTFFLSQLVVKVSMCLSNVTAREQLRYLATRDPLTDLPNRRALEATLIQEISRTRRYGHSLALLFIDCDDFKGINDRYGHDCGDAFLRHVAAEMKNELRPSDMIFRFAGDEFVVLLPYQGIREAMIVAARLREHLRRRPMSYEGNPVAVSVSFGAASTGDDGIHDADTLLRKADERLYQAKQRR